MTYSLTSFTLLTSFNKQEFFMNNYTNCKSLYPGYNDVFMAPNTSILSVSYCDSSIKLCYLEDGCKDIHDKECVVFYVIETNAFLPKIKNRLFEFIGSVVNTDNDEIHHVFLIKVES